MLPEKLRLEKLIRSIQEKLCTYPEGNLVCTKNGKRRKWYLSDGHNLSYIPKSDRKLAEQLAAKKYLSMQLEELLQEQKAINAYLKQHKVQTASAEQLLTDDSGYTELLAPYFAPPSQELLTWAQSPYEHNLKNPDQLSHKASSGNLVRSKSEALIDMMLYTHQIPFRYECALDLGQRTLFPDFTIRHPVTEQVFYWEHFGMMDNPEYCRNALSKLQLYISEGIIPSVQLITTYETKEHPLDSQYVECIIKHHFL